MVRVGVDFGGTKIEAAAFAEDGRALKRLRLPTPHDYDAALEVVRALSEAVAGEAADWTLGVGHPGSLSPATGLIRNANSTWLNGRPFGRDLEAKCGRAVRLANDADCLALSEAADGAAAGAGVVFAVILGTGCGGGLVVHGRHLEGRNRMAGEWGHTPLPWPDNEEHPGPACWCGRSGCLETWLSGPALAADHARVTGETASPEAIVEAMRRGRPAAQATFERWRDRLARGLAVVCDLLDPDVIVLGGGLSNVAEVYDGLSKRIGARVFSDVFTTPVVPARWGDSSGVRGAARLWP